MSTFLFDEVVFGPIDSRRLGKSLGINLLSKEHKVCNFDCIYCECGFTEKEIKNEDKFCSIEELKMRLERFMSDPDRGPIDAITYAGNGEPTLHPKFEEISAFVEMIGSKYSPESRIVLLTNGTTLRKKSVRNSLQYIDEIVIKLDAGQDELIKRIDRPLSPFNIQNFVSSIIELEHPVSIQSMFIRGADNHGKIDNTEEQNLANWLNWIEEIKPKMVMLYSISRDTPLETIEPVPKEELDRIAEKVAQLGIKTMVS